MNNSGIITRRKRYYHSIRLFLFWSNGKKKTEYLKKHNLLGGIGENCQWGPWLLPLYSNMIKLHNNVVIHKRARLITHDMINRFLSICSPETDFGSIERLGPIEIMDNVYVSRGAVILPNVRIGKNCIISANSVVTTDIPDNCIATGVPAKPIGRFDVFMAMRKMQAKQNIKFKNQELPPEVAAAEWEKFYRKRDGNKNT